ncbi:hypothetical protein ElyMa_006039500 [Elysia marginata]|uniref:Uncharacterized protein n=1 Tax=Elysia marginata TaxID=1093978 RepID=A0AAV4GLF2_9GAST|nr:hypothetical protein ElyMa_006039500 [Elysia marginata]
MRFINKKNSMCESFAFSTFTCNKGFVQRARKAPGGFCKLRSIINSQRGAKNVQHKVVSRARDERKGTRIRVLMFQAHDCIATWFAIAFLTAFTFAVLRYLATH